MHLKILVTGKALDACGSVADKTADAVIFPGKSECESFFAIQNPEEKVPEAVKSMDGYQFMNLSGRAGQTVSIYKVTATQAELLRAFNPGCRLELVA